MTVTLSSASDGTGKKKGRTVTVTTKDMQKRTNDVKARTTLLLSLPDEHQLRFSKYKTTQGLWDAILKTFSGNEATKKTNKNLLKQQYGNFKAEGSKTLEQTFNRLLAPEWLMHTIVWRNKSDLDTISLDDLYNHLKVYESEVQKKLEPNSQNMAFISSAKHNRGNEEDNTASVSTASTNVPTASANIGVASISQDTDCAYITSQSSGKKISIQGIDVAGFDKSKAIKALMEIDGVGWDWSYMANDEENHALITDEETPIEFALMAKTSSKSEVFDNSLCSKAYYIESLKKKLELIKKEKEGLDSKLTGFQIASKDLVRLLESQRLDKNKEGLGYSVVPPPPAQIYSFPKKDISWTGLPEFKDDTANDSPTNSKTDKAETTKKSLVKYAEQYRKPIKKPNVRGNQRNWNNLKSHQFGPNFVIEKKACFNYGDFNHLAYDCRKRVKKGTSRNVPPVNRKFSTVSRKFPTTNRKIPTGSTKFSTADMGKKGNTIKASACWIWKPSQNTTNKGPNSNSISVMFKKYTYIDTQGRLNGCSRHMTDNISYLSDYEPFDGGYVSFGQGGCKITGKETIKTSKLEFQNVYFVKDLKYNLFSVSQICNNKNSVLFIDSECIMLGRDFKLLDDANVLLRTPRQHNMCSVLDLDW
uniref:Ribonuclease H-like domain-containing protein n=1 Tax=Tanacetum cinerariifolium TaxID=118510 RepID=A0A699H468_TANCI|nr:ribonuclease H-like domain-containing protein [Tanacetum cinerariifolium]